MYNKLLVLAPDDLASLNNVACLLADLLTFNSASDIEAGRAAD